MRPARLGVIGTFLWLVAACGGGSSASPEALLRITPPQDPQDVAVAVGRDGKAEVLRGLTDEDRAAGRRFPSRHVYPASADTIRVAADGTQPWPILQGALGKAADRGMPTVELTILDGGGALHRLRFQTRFSRAREDMRRQRLHLTLSGSGDDLLLAAELPGGAWLRAHGCGSEGEENESSWRWRGGLVPSGFFDLFYEVLKLVADDPAALDIQIDVADGGEGSVPAIADVGQLLAALLERGVTRIDVGLRGRSYGRRFISSAEASLKWLAAHQAADGAWHGDAWATWCHREPMAAEVAGDGNEAFDVGATGLALSAFLGAGYTHRGRHPFAKTVAPGLRALKQRQAPDGTYGQPGTPYRARNQALAALALGRAWDLTESELWMAAAQRAQTALRNVWREEPDDVLATGFAVLAFIERSDRARDPAFREELHAKCRALAENGDRLALAVGLAGCLLLGDDADDPHWNDQVAQTLQAEGIVLDVHEMLFFALAAYGLAGKAFKAWNGIARAMEKANSSEGHPCCLGGSWNPPEGYPLPGGRVEATGLHAMAFQVYFRYDKAIEALR